MLNHKQEWAYQNLQDKPQLIKNGVPKLAAVNGSNLETIGQIYLDINMKGNKMKQRFVVIDRLGRNFILGLDWMKANGVRIYFDLGALRVGKTYVKLEEDVHVCTPLSELCQK